MGGVGIEDSKSATTSVLLNESKTIKAKFVSDPNYNGDPTAPGLHSLNLTSLPAKGGNTEGSGIYGTGWINISASNQPGYVFSHWDADGVESVNSSSTRIFLTKNIEVTANFRLLTGADLINGSVQLGNSWWYSDWFGPFCTGRAIFGLIIRCWDGCSWIRKKQICRFGFGLNSSMVGNGRPRIFIPLFIRTIQRLGIGSTRICLPWETGFSSGTAIPREMGNGSVSNPDGRFLGLRFTRTSFPFRTMAG